MNKNLFGTDGIRGKSNSFPMTPEVIVKIGKAVGLILKIRTGKIHPKVVLGKDTRICSYVIETALTSGLCSVGVNVKLIGPLPTPGIAYLVRSMIADLGIMLTASHNPASDNGIKLFSELGIKISEDFEKEIEEKVFNEDISSAHIFGELIGKASRIENATGRFVEFLKLSIKTNLKGLKIAIDCANGAAYKVVPLLFKELGAESIILNNTPNGLNINKNCGALHTGDLQKIVVEQACNLGVAFDGDADRVVFVDKHGEVINGDHILYLLAVKLKEANKLSENTVVVTHYSNFALDSLWGEQGIKVLRVENGDKYVIRAIMEKNLSFGGEKSGHIILGNYNSTGDGLLSSLYLCKELLLNPELLDNLSVNYPLYPQILKNISVKERRPFDEIEGFSALLQKIKKSLGEQGRILVRYSGTENICRIMLEGKYEKEINNFCLEVANFLENHIGK